MARLILIRHGETEYNFENRYCGFSDPPLNTKGIWQSKRLANRLKSLKIDKIYSSDLRRAYQTAKIIFKNNLIEKSESFREVNFGIFEGLRYEEILKVYPELYKDWIDNPVKVKIPNGESLKNLSKRVKEKLSSIFSQYKDKTIAVVTHGGPIRVILCDALKYNLEMFWQIKQQPGALNIIDDVETSLPVVVKMNDVSHLSIKEEVVL